MYGECGVFFVREFFANIIKEQEISEDDQSGAAEHQYSGNIAAEYRSAGKGEHYSVSGEAGFQGDRADGSADGQHEGCHLHEARSGGGDGAVRRGRD